MELAILVQPRASRTEIVGAQGEALKVRLAAPPVDGAANEELIRHLARVFGVPVRAVTIRSGASTRRKRVRVEGLDAAAVRRLL